MSDNTENKQPLGFFNIEENEDGINWGEVVNSIRESNGLERLSDEELQSPVEKSSSDNNDEDVE